jgi:hypothetical protein
MDSGLQQLCAALENAKSANEALRRSAAEFLMNVRYEHISPYSERACSPIKIPAHQKKKKIRF